MNSYELNQLEGLINSYGILKKKLTAKDFLSNPKIFPTKVILSFLTSSEQLVVSRVNKKLNNIVIKYADKDFKKLISQIISKVNEYIPLSWNNISDFFNLDLSNIEYVLQNQFFINKDLNKYSIMDNIIAPFLYYKIIKEKKSKDDKMLDIRTFYLCNINTFVLLLYLCKLPINYIEEFHFTYHYYTNRNVSLDNDYLISRIISKLALNHSKSILKFSLSINNNKINLDKISILACTDNTNYIKNNNDNVDKNLNNKIDDKSNFYSMFPHYFLNIINLKIQNVVFSKNIEYDKLFQLENLELYAVDLNETFKDFSMRLSKLKRLKVLSLNNCNISNKYFKSFTDYLTSWKCKSLNELYLNDNLMDHYCLKFLSEALIKNKTLRILEINKIKIKETYTEFVYDFFNVIELYSIIRLSYSHNYYNKHVIGLIYQKLSDVNCNININFLDMGNNQCFHKTNLIPSHFTKNLNEEEIKRKGVYFIWDAEYYNKE